MSDEVKAKRPVYLCAFSNPKCRKSIGCLRNGGPCMKTFNVKYAEINVEGAPIICEYLDQEMVVRTEESEE